jgi:hypothetical protein
MEERHQAQLVVCQERSPLSPENSQPVQGNFATQSEATRPAKLGRTAHLSAHKVALAATQDQAGDAARDKDGQQWGPAKSGDAGPEEGGERFSQNNTLRLMAELPTIVALHPLAAY